MKNMNTYIKDDLTTHLQYYFDLIYTMNLDLEIDGIKAFNEKSQFVEGKVVNACSYVYESIISNAPNREIVGIKLKDIIDLMSDRKYETWGILNCITALNRLKNKNEIDNVVSPEALERFKLKLDWRTFVNEDDLTLIDKPTNYYGVAFGIAKYRELLNFEPAGWSEKLLKKLLKHVDDFSGEFSYMDETNGQGRFDRYSILIPAEICSMLHATDCDIPEKLITMLRKSCDIYMNLANVYGHGFSYGRSIGAYGDTAALEILSISAKLGILKEDEMDIAYAYNTKTVQKFVEFWIDSDTKSLNMWDKGRKTDDYRNKNRILGENLSLSMQIINSFEYWKDSGYENKQPIAYFTKEINNLPNFSKFMFADDEYSRSMYIIRDNKHVISLPLINGADKYYNETPYLPIPNEFNVFTSTANSKHPNLVPKLTFKDGKEVMPIVYIKNVTDNLNDNDPKYFKVNYELDNFALLGKNIPEKFEGVFTVVNYKFKKGYIQCDMKMVFEDKLISGLEKIEMEFGSFSIDPTIKEGTVAYNKGSVQTVTASGFDCCKINDVVDNEDYFTPVGPINNTINWTLDKSLKDIGSNSSIKISWTLTYI